MPTNWWTTTFLSLFAGFLLLAGDPTHTDAAGPNQSAPLADARRPRVSEIMESCWPGHPEWLAMFAEILDGGQLAPDTGWYRQAVAQTRFDWKWVENRYDRNHDHRIDRSEFSGSSNDFGRLDRDHDQSLTSSDFELAERGSARVRGEEVFSIDSFATADRDRDGRLSVAEFHQFLALGGQDPVHQSIISGVRDELTARLRAAEREGVSFLALADFQEAFILAARRNVLPERLNAPGTSPPVPTDVLLRAFLRGELGAWGPGPRVNEPAPDFTLATSDGRVKIRLFEYPGRQPIVLVFGSLTCDPFRGHAGSLDVLRQRYRDRARFLMVYTREAHPNDGWRLDQNARAGVSVRQPLEIGEREGLARMCRKRLALGFPIVVDQMDDRISRQYSGIPSRLYLIDHEGKIAYKSGRSPFGFKPAELEQSLILLLESSRGAGSQGSQPGGAS